MDIDQTNGKLYFVFYDRRNYTDSQTEVYIAYSDNGGKSFINNIISESPFIPNEGIFFGDYTNIVAHDDVVRPIWTRLHEGKLSIWTDITPFDKILAVGNQTKLSRSNNIVQYPNPTSNISYVSFKLHELSIINLEMYDQQGRLVRSIINNNKMSYGKYIVPIDMDNIDLPEGTYYINISINDKEKVLKSIVIK